jgi:hypothetical protein
VAGKILKDQENGQTNSCSADDNNKCMDKCVSDLYKGLEKDPPPYSWTKGSPASQCQKINRDIVELCTQQCAAKRK